MAGRQASKHGIELRIMHGILSFEIIKNSINISYYNLNLDGCLEIHNFEEGGFWYGILERITRSAVDRMRYSYAVYIRFQISRHN